MFYMNLMVTINQKPRIYKKLREMNLSITLRKAVKPPGKRQGEEERNGEELHK